MKAPSITIRSVTATPLKELLQQHNYGCVAVTENVFRITKQDFEVYIHQGEHSLYFEASVGEANAIKSLELYEDLLDLNTEVLPVSIGLDKSDPKNPRLVVVESREIANLDEDELLSVLQAVEITLAKVEVLLNKHFSN